jgi:hypothetical protein
MKKEQIDQNSLFCFKNFRFVSSRLAESFSVSNTALILLLQPHLENLKDQRPRPDDSMVAPVLTRERVMAQP